MKTQPVYFRYIPWLLGIGCLSFGVQIFAAWTDSYNIENRKSMEYVATRFFDWVVNSANYAVLWWVIGQMTNKKRAALITIGCCLVLQLVWIIAWSLVPYPSAWHLPIRLSYVLPYLIFSLLAFQRIGWAALYASLTVLGISLAYTGNYQIEELVSDLLRQIDLDHLVTISFSESETSRRSFGLIGPFLNIFLPALEFALIAEWFSRQGRAETPLAPRRLHLDQYCPKGVATLVFYTFRLGLYGIALGFGAMLLSGFDAPEEFRRPWLRTGVTLLSGLGLLYFTVWYTRKFLSEYFLTRSAVPAWGFWVLNIPVIDLMLWPLIGLTKPAPMPASERPAFFEAARSSEDSHSLKFVVAGIQILYLLVLLATDSPLAAIGTAVFSVALTVYYLFNPNGFWVMSGLLFLSLVALVYVIMERSMYGDASRILLSYLFYSFSFIYIMMAAFHLPVFSAATGEEQAITPSDALPENDDILDAPMG